MQALLSEHWHAVRGLRPRLRDGVRPLHRRLRGRTWVLLLDPLTMRFHRMTPQVWDVLQLLDGRRTLEAVWSAACAKADTVDAATQQLEAAGVISQHELVLAGQHWTALTENLSDRVLSAGNLALLWLVYPLVKAVHEWAHGMAVKAWGGNVREIGLMFIIFTPVPYVDATASYSFPSKWARAAVAAAGIMAELSLGAVALYVWLAAESGLVTAVAYNVVLIAGVSTLLINGNPLMRYDGYFIATDLLELPNLAQRATQYCSYLVDRWAFGAREARPPEGVTNDRGERWILLFYGIVSPIYRLLITIGLIWFVASEYLLVGAIMALMAIWSTLLVPLWKGWKHLAEAPALLRRRENAMRRTALALVLLAAFIGLVPLPFHSVHQGVVWLPDEAIVRAEVSGHVAQVQRAPGAAVAAGDILLQLENLPLQAELGQAAALVVQAEARLRKAQVDEQVKVAPLLADLQARQARLADAQRRVLALEVHAGAAGRWVPQATTELQGRHVQRGAVLGHVVAGPSQRVRAAIPQEDMDLINAHLEAVQVRLPGRPAQVLDARLLRQVPGGERLLVSAALGTGGGGAIAVDPAREGGTTPLQRVFDLELGLAQPVPSAVFGERVDVRFDLGHAPLGWQWFLRLRQVFLAHLNL